MIPVEQLRRAADAVLSRVENLQYDITEFRRYRRRPGNGGGCYYGSVFFNNVEVAGSAPELQLTRSAPRGHLRFGSDLFSAWIVGLGDLTLMVRCPVSYILDWSHNSYVPLDDAGHVLVFPANRQSFGAALARVSGCGSVRCGQALRHRRTH